MKLSLPEDLMQAIREHARRSYPDECCGVMVGQFERATDHTRVRELVAAENSREAEARSRRFLIEPRVILETARRARESGLDIVGYYHSHPDHPAEPSEFDREHAWPETSYLIVSVRDGQDAEARSWRLRDDRSSYEEETLDAGTTPAPEESVSSDETKTEETTA